MNLNTKPKTTDVSYWEDGFWSKDVGSVNTLDNNGDFYIT